MLAASVVVSFIGFGSIHGRGPAIIGCWPREYRPAGRLAQAQVQRCAGVSGHAEGPPRARRPAAIARSTPGGRSAAGEAAGGCSSSAIRRSSSVNQEVYRELVAPRLGGDDRGAEPLAPRLLGRPPSSPAALAGLEGALRPTPVVLRGTPAAPLLPARPRALMPAVRARRRASSRRSRSRSPPTQWGFALRAPGHTVRRPVLREHRPATAAPGPLAAQRACCATPRSSPPARRRAGGSRARGARAARSRSRRRRCPSWPRRAPAPRRSGRSRSATPAAWSRARG